MKYTSKEIKQLIEQLDKLLSLDREEGMVIGLQGHWGIGKTFFWNYYIESKEQGDKFVNISLFGINNIEEIKKKIILKVSDRAKIAENLKSFSGVFKKFEIDISSFISLIDKEDFKNKVVCIDDFERISPNLSISEVMGYISELKEQYNCKVVLINNNDMLKEQDNLNHKKYFKKYISEDKKEKIECDYIVQTNNQEIFDTYSEKIIDVTLWYEPHLKDTMEFIKEKYKNKDYIAWELIEKLFGAIKDKNEKFNIRLIKKLILKLEIFEDTLKDENIDIKIKNGIVVELFKNIIKESVYLYNLVIEQNVRDGHEEIFKDAVEKHQIDLENFKKEITDFNKQLKQNYIETQIPNDINKIYFDYLYDLKYNDEEFIKDLYDLLNTKDINIIKVLGLPTFEDYVQNFLIKLEKDEQQKEKYKQLFTEKLEFYIKKNNICLHDIKHLLDSTKDIIGENNTNRLKDLFEEKEYIPEAKIDLKQKIVSDINLRLLGRGWGKEEEKIFENIDKEQHKIWLEEDRVYFEAVFKFCGWIGNFSGNKPFENFYNMTMEVYEKLEEEEQYKHKMSFVLKHFGLNDKNKDEQEEVK